MFSPFSSFFTMESTLSNQSTTGNSDLLRTDAQYLDSLTGDNMDKAVLKQGEFQTSLFSKLKSDEDYSTLMKSQLLFNCDEVSAHLEMIEKKAISSGDISDTDVTFYTSYLIAMLQLNHFQPNTFVTSLKKSNFMNVYRSDKDNMYIMTYADLSTDISSDAQGRTI